MAEETVWLTQKSISVLFDKGRSTITEHLQNIFTTGELSEEAACRDFRHTANDGKAYTTRFYNLDAVIAVGYRKYRVVQDRLFESDFDRAMKQLPGKGEDPAAK